MTFLVVQAGFALLFALFRVNVKIRIKMKYIAIICIVLYFIKMLHSLYNHDEAYAGWLCAIMWAVIFLIKFGSE
mgnify:FL=1